MSPADGVRVPDDPAPRAPHDEPAVPSVKGRYSCARASVACGEAVHGTASTVRRWVLLEQPGAWGVDAVPDSRLGRELAERLCDHVEDGGGARLVLIRRTGGGQATAGRRVYVAWCAPGASWLEQLTLRDPADLLDHDLSPLRDGGSVGGRRLRDPVYLVCTNGKKDPCCAEFGLPIARTLAGALGDRLWESSHIGGDRFAGNLVVLPHGAYYGHVTVDSATEIVAAHDAGLVHLDGYRGRSVHPFVVQAADDLVRRRLGLSGLEDLVHTRADVDGARTEVGFTDHAGRRIVAVVRTDRAEPRRLTCHARAAERPPAYTLTSLSVDGEPVE